MPRRMTECNLRQRTHTLPPACRCLLSFQRGSLRLSLLFSSCRGVQVEAGSLSGQTDGCYTACVQLLLSCCQLELVPHRNYIRTRVDGNASIVAGDRLVASFTIDTRHNILMRKIKSAHFTSSATRSPTPCKRRSTNEAFNFISGDKICVECELAPSVAQLTCASGVQA